MAPPIMTPEQRDAARVKAGQVRTARAELKGRLKRGEITLADAVAGELTARMKVSELLAALPGVGKAKAADVMERLKISDNRRVGGLGTNQRAELLGLFADVPA
jgi:hypothetical protein